MTRLLLISTLFTSGCLFTSGLLSRECNDGFVDPPEECDDLNNTFGDGCSPECLQEVAQSSTEEINGANINNARFAFFTTRTAPVDITNPADGVIDLDLGILEIIVSDREDMCDVLAVNPSALDPNSDEALADVQSIKISVFRRAPIGQSDFVAGETISTNTGILNAVFGLGADSIFVGAAILIRAGGVNQVFADTPPFNSNNGAISFNEVSDTLEANMSVTLTAEHVEGPFDTRSDPFNLNLPFDLRTINSPVSLSVKNISRCE